TITASSPSNQQAPAQIIQTVFLKINPLPGTPTNLIQVIRSLRFKRGGALYTYQPSRQLSFFTLSPRQVAAAKEAAHCNL
ncbi:MAG: hypothetical protein AB1766_01345, partial [Pseudomonadota bacterium]